MNKDFLSIFDITGSELEGMFSLADELKLSRHFRPLEGMTAALIFQKPSLRTRASFEIGVAQLGGQSVHFTDEGIGLGVRETPGDVAMLLSRYADLIVARVFGHDLLEQMAAHATIPVVNALSDRSHPCQIIADMYTIRQHGLLAPGVRICYVGDGNNVANSWIEMAAIWPIRLTVVTPEGYDPDAEILATAQRQAAFPIVICHDPATAVRNADVVYTDVWASMGQEEETAIRKKEFARFQVTQSLMKQASADAIFMHCLPAHRGQEVTAEVIDGARSVIFDQAENRLHMQKALLTRLAHRDHGTEALLHEELVPSMIR